LRGGFDRHAERHPLPTIIDSAAGKISISTTRLGRAITMSVFTSTGSSLLIRMRLAR
jgi:hypothetical protein